MPYPLFVVDAFTSRPFTGNPAAVCLLPSPAPEVWMQQVAAEMNLSETAFLHPEPDGWRLRWFTPTIEVTLCGHATLASAHVLWQQGQVPPGQEISFHTLSGLLTARPHTQGIELDFPSRSSREQPPPAGVFQALGAAGVWSGSNELDWLIELADEAEVRRLRPDFAALRALLTRGVIVTAHSTQPEFDFVSRFFAPGAGINEDPVTGSAHCALAPFWASRLGRNSLTGYQASVRGGVVGVELRGDRVLLRGQALLVLRGELLAEE